MGSPARRPHGATQAPGAIAGWWGQNGVGPPDDMLLAPACVAMECSKLDGGGVICPWRAHRCQGLGWGVEPVLP